jgi:hypothetical protein
MAGKDAKILILAAVLVVCLRRSISPEQAKVRSLATKTTSPSSRCFTEYLSGEVEAWHIAPNYSELLDDVKLVRGASRRSTWTSIGID